MNTSKQRCTALFGLMRRVCDGRLSSAMAECAYYTARNRSLYQNGSEEAAESCDDRKEGPPASWMRQKSRVANMMPPEKD